MYLIEYTGDGQTTEFEFSFPFFKAADVKVSINSELLVQGAFTVTFSELAQSDGMYSGGRVIFTDAPALGADIRIWRKIDLARVIDYQPTLPIQTESLNADFNFMLEYLKDLYELDGDVANIENGLQFLDSIQDQIEKLGNLGELAKKDEIPDVSNFATKDEIPDISNLAEKDHTHDMSEYATKTEVSTGLSSKQNSLTNAEMQAVDSGITESKVATYDAYAQQIAGKVNTQQGSANAGKVLQVGNDGNLFLSSEGSGILSVNHDNTLYGSGTSSDPLGVSSNERICNKIANCILQIPQNINLTFSNGVLTLKAGSTVYVPNGTGNFVVIKINADITRSNLSGTNVLIVATPGADLNSIQSLGAGSLLTAASGGTEPSSYSYWYDTTNNYLYTSGTTSLRSLPLGYIDSNGTLNVFNGFGFIGTTVFSLPGLMVATPNGRNTDGTLKSNIIAQTSVNTYTLDSSVRNELWGNSSNLFTVGKGTYTYNEDRNYIINASDGGIRNYAKIADLTIDSSFKIIGMLPRNVFKAVDYEDYQKTTYNKADVDLSNVSENIDFIVSSQEPTAENGYTWYRKYKSGWVEQGSVFIGINTAGVNTITFPIPFRDTGYFIVKNPGTNSSDTISWRCVSFYNLTTTQATTYNSLSGYETNRWYACGYSAQ